MPEERSTQTHQDPITPRHSNMRRHLCALLTCIWISFLLGVLCTVLTVRLKYQTESSLKALSRYYEKQQRIQAQTALERERSSQLFCNDAVCKWQTNYLWDRLNDSVDPCDDFYSYVCSATWFTGQGVEDQPFAQFSSAQLMADVDDVLSRHLAASNDGSWSFVYQSAELLMACAYSEKPVTSWESLKEALDDYGIGGWPYAKGLQNNVSLVALVGKMEREMGFSPFADVTLSKDFVSADYQIHLNPPQTLLRKFVLHRNSTGVPIANYQVGLVELFEKSGIATHDAERMAADILAFEKHLEAIGDVDVLPVQERLADVRELGNVSKWSWQAFLNIVFADVRNTTDAAIICVCCSFFRKLTLLIEETPLADVANLVGLRMLVLLSPLLPEQNHLLSLLNQETSGLSGVPERLQSCVGLLERAYRYGTAMLARMSLSKNFPSVYRTHYDKEIAQLLRTVMRSLIRRAAKVPWLTQLFERTIASVKFRSMSHEVFGTAPSLYWPALYYGVGSPRINASDPIKSYLKLLQHTRRAYLASTAPNLDLDAKYPGRVFVPETVYFPLRNVLFIPQSVVAFLNHVSNSIESVFVPAVGRAILNGALRALDGVGSHVDDRYMLRRWWTADTSAKFSALKDCLVDQYSRMYWPKGEMRGWQSYVDINTIYREGALLAPLYDAFLEHSSSSYLTVKLSNGRALHSKKLFFVNYALSVCDHHPLSDVVRIQRKLRVVPGVVLVNLAIMNFKEFARVFKCKAGVAMNPASRCKFW